MDATSRAQRTDIACLAAAFTPEVVLRRRIDPEACGHYITALRRAIDNLVKALPDVRTDLQIACALLPGGKKMFDFRCRPENLEPNFQNGLRESWGTLPIPVVREGPVVLNIRILIGITVPEDSKLPLFLFPFLHLFPRGTSRFDEVLLRAAGIAPEEVAGASQAMEGVGPLGRRKTEGPGLWLRLKTWLRNQRHIILPSAEETFAASGDPREPDLPPEVQARLLGSSTIEDLTEWIRQHPQSACLRRLRGVRLQDEGKLDAAIEDFSAAIALRPQDADAFAGRGTFHLLTGRLEPGLTDLNEALRLEPDHVGALSGRTMVYVELGAWPQAAVDLDNAIRMAPFLVRLRFLRAKLWLFRTDGNSDANRAVTDLDEILRLDPYHEEAYRLRGRARQLMISHNLPLDQAAAAPILSDLERAIWLDPESSPAYLDRGFVFRRAGNLDRALADCERALEIDPNQPDALGLRGVIYFDRSDFDQAFRDCTAAIEKGGGLPEYFMCRAQILSTRGDLDLAMEAIDRVLEMRPNDPVALFLRGNIHLQGDDAEAAMADFTEVLRRQPGNALARVNRGLARWRTDSGVALEDFEEALRGDPTLAHAHFYRGAILIGQGRRPEALESLGEAIRLAPEFPLPYFARAGLRGETGDLEGALADFEAVIRLAPEFPQAYHERGCLLAGRGDMDAALRDFDHLVDLCPSSALGYIGRAKVRIAQGDFDRAGEDYREAIQNSPTNAEDIILDRLVTEAAYYHKVARHAEAIEKANEALELRPDFLPAHFQRGCASWYHGRLTEAAEDFGRILELSGESGPVLGCRGQVYAEMGEFQLAIGDLDRALELSRDARDNAGTAYALSGRGLARGGLGLFVEASRDFEESLRLSPDNAWAHLNLGIVLEKQGKRTEAAAALRRALLADQPPLTKRKCSQAEALLARLEPGNEPPENG